MALGVCFFPGFCTSRGERKEENLRLGERCRLVGVSAVVAVCQWVALRWWWWYFCSFPVVTMMHRGLPQQGRLNACSGHDFRLSEPFRFPGAGAPWGIDPRNT